MPAAREDKPLFSDIPDDFRRKIEDFLGARIASAKTLYGGFSPSANFALALEDGRRFFAKGNHPGEMAHGIENLRQEIKAYQTIDAIRHISPRFVGSVFDGDEDGWALGLWEYIAQNGTPSVHEMIDLTLDFSTRGNVDLRRATDHNYIGAILAAEGKWQRLATDATARKSFAALFQECDIDWLIATFARLQEITCVAAHETGLVHGDLRPDNFIRSTKGTSEKTYVIDWANACFGPLAFDRVMLHAALRGLGGVTDERIFSGISNDARRDMTVLLAGYFALQSWRSVPPRLPRLRWMQKCMLGGLLADSTSLGIIESIPQMQGTRRESIA